MIGIGGATSTMKLAKTSVKCQVVDYATHVCRMFFSVRSKDFRASGFLSKVLCFIHRYLSIILFWLKPTKMQAAHYLKNILGKQLASKVLFTYHTCSITLQHKKSPTAYRNPNSHLPIFKIPLASTSLQRELKCVEHTLSTSTSC